MSSRLTHAPLSLPHLCVSYLLQSNQLAPRDGGTEPVASSARRDQDEFDQTSPMSTSRGGSKTVAFTTVGTHTTEDARQESSFRQVGCEALIAARYGVWWRWFTMSRCAENLTVPPMFVFLGPR